MNKTLIVVISALIGAAVYALSYGFLMKAKDKAIHEEEYDGDIKEIKKSFKEQILFAVLGAAATGLAGYTFLLQMSRLNVSDLLSGGLLDSLVAQTVTPASVITTILVSLFFYMLIVIAFVDLQTMEIPQYLNVIILVLGAVRIAVNFIFNGSEGLPVLIDALIGMVCVSVPMIILNLIIKGAFGGGDIKLLFAAGLFLGWKGAVSGFFMGAVVGAIVGLTSMAMKKAGRKSHIPFGPSLCIGLIAATVWGTALINWYAGIIVNSMSHY